MTKKDFELIARTLRASAPDNPANSVATQRVQDMQHAATVERFADALAGTNARFDRARFVAAALED